MRDMRNDAKDSKRSVIRIGLVVAAIVSSVGGSSRYTLAASPAPREPDSPTGIHGGGDGGTLEVGVEYVQEYSPFANNLPNTAPDALGLYNILGAGGWNKRYAYGNRLAWEEDWKSAARGGTEASYVDTVDLAYFSGHGAPGRYDSFWNRYLNSPMFGVGGNTHDDSFLVPGDAYKSYGDWDVEWIGFSACQVLRGESMAYWAATLNGAHLIMGFDTNMYDVKFGEPFGQRIRWGWTLPQAWFGASYVTQNDIARSQHKTVRARVLAEEPCQFNDRVGSSCGDFPQNGTFHWLDSALAYGPDNVLVANAPLQTVDASDLPTLDILSAAPNESELAALSNNFGFSPNSPAALDDASQLYRNAETNSGLDLTVDQQGKYFFANVNSLFVVPTQTLSLSAEAPAITPQDALTIAQSYLRQRNLLPTDAVLQGVVTDTLVTGQFSPTLAVGNALDGKPIMVNRLEQAVVSEIPVAYQVIYGRALSLTLNSGGNSSVPVYGPGSVLKVFVGTDGKVNGVMGGWRSVSNFGSLGTGNTTLSSAQAISLFKALGDQVNLMPSRFQADVITVTNTSVGYFEQPLGTRQAVMAPTYVLDLDLQSTSANTGGFNMAPQANAENTLSTTAYIPATTSQLPPLAAIIAPVVPTPTVAYREVVTLTAADSSQTLAALGYGNGLNFVMGTGPFTYTWKLQTSGKVLGTGRTITYAVGIDDNLTVMKDTSDTPTGITLEVTDSTGKTGRAGKLFYFLSASGAPVIRRVSLPVLMR